MSDDRIRPEQIAARQVRSLPEYIDSVVRPFSPGWRRRLDDAKVPASPRVTDLPVTRLHELTGDGDLVIRVRPEDLTTTGPTLDRLRYRARLLAGQREQVERGEIEPAYRPVHWFRSGPLTVAASSVDLDVLAELGRRGLEHVGLRRDDRVVNLLPSADGVETWQLVFGLRRAGIAATHLPANSSLADVREAAPTVLAASPDTLSRLLASPGASGLAELRALISVGGPADGHRTLIPSARELGCGLAAWWAAPGARHAWVGCDASSRLHTFPDNEIVEVVDADGKPTDGVGRILLTGIGWSGTPLLRIDTGIRGTLLTASCPVCGRTTPRVDLAPSTSRPTSGAESAPSNPSERSAAEVAAVLDAAEQIVVWQAEIRTVGAHDELIVFVVPSSPSVRPTLRAIDRELGVTQFVVVNRRQFRDRMAEVGEDQLVDLR